MLGKWMEARAKRQTTEAIRALQALRPETARVRQGDTEVDLPLAQVRVGDGETAGDAALVPVGGESPVGLHGKEKLFGVGATGGRHRLGDGQEHGRLWVGWERFREFFGVRKSGPLHQP